MKVGIRLAYFYERKSHMQINAIESWIKGKNKVMAFQADPYIIAWLEKWAKKQLNKEFLDWNFVTLTQDKSDFQQCLEDIGSFSLVDSQRILFLKDFRIKDRQMGLWNKEDFLSLAEAVSKAPEDIIIILFLEEADRRSKEYKALSKVFHVLDTTRWTETELHGHLKEYIKNQGSEPIQDSLIAYYIRICGYTQKDSTKTLLQIHWEMDKLLAWKKQGKALSKDAVENLIQSEEEVDIFHLTDVIFEGRLEEALEGYERLYAERKSSAPIMGWINSTLSLLLKGDYLQQEGFSLKQIAHTLNVHEFRMKKTMGILRKITRKQAMVMLNNNLDLEYKMKTGNMTDDLLGELAILKMIQSIKTSL